jgi:hypothetical protein
MKEQVADKDGLRNTGDDLLTNSETDDLPMEGKHEDFPKNSNVPWRPACGNWW